jgi:hypothetical protein
VPPLCARPHVALEDHFEELERVLVEPSTDYWKSVTLAAVLAPEVLEPVLKKAMNGSDTVAARFDKHPSRVPRARVTPGGITCPPARD